MARLPGMDPKSLDYVAGRMTGIVDYYYWRGIACARAWPFGAEKFQSVARQKSAYVFSEIARMKAEAIAEAVAGWMMGSVGTTWTWGDFLVHLGMAYYGETGNVPPQILALSYTFA